MRSVFLLDKNVSDDFKDFMTKKLEIIGGVLGFFIHENRVEVTFKNGEDDEDSICELISSKGYQVIEEVEPFKIGRRTVLLAIFIFAASVFYDYGIFRTIMCVLMLFVVSYKIIAYAIDELKERRLSVALFSLIFGAVSILTGFYEFIVPSKRVSMALLGSFVSAVVVLYYFIKTNKRG